MFVAFFALSLGKDVEVTLSQVSCMYCSSFSCISCKMLSSVQVDETCKTSRRGTLFDAEPKITKSKVPSRSE